MSTPSTPSSQVIPGAWPDLQSTTDVQPDSPPPHHLDQVLSFHKRLSLTFSSPILMPTRSPLLGISSSASSTGLTVGSQHDTTTSLSALADESISTTYSSDSALEVASQLRLSESASVPYVPTTTNAYASPNISRNLHAFPTLPSPTEHQSKNSRPTTSHMSRPPPRLTLSVPDDFSSTESPSTIDSPLASPVTPPSPASTASPGPIIFASPSSSSFSFRTPFPSQDPLSMTTDMLPLPKDWQTRSFSNEHVRTNANLDTHTRPELTFHADSYSTVARSELSFRDESILPSTPTSPRKPWSDFAKDNSRDASPSPLSGKDKRNTSDHRTISPRSRRVLSTIQATTPLSSNRSHTLSLSLTRPAHTRTTSSASQLTPTRIPFRSNSISSPYVTPRLSFPSRSPSPSPARPTESESKSHKRSISISLLRSISDRSKARFSRSIHTGDVSIAAADYAAEQCEAAFVSRDQNVGAEIVVENRAIEVVSEEESGGNAGEGQEVAETDGGEKVHHRSMFRKMKEFGGKVRKLIRGMRVSPPSVGADSEEATKVRVDVVNTQDVATQTSPQIQSQTNSRPKLGPKSRSSPILDAPPRRRQLKHPPARPLSLSLSFPPMGGNLPGYPFIVPSVHVSSPTSSPPGLPVPTFSGSTTTTAKSRFSKLYSSSPLENESFPTLTELVEPKTRAVSKIDEIEVTESGATGASAGNGFSSPATLRKAKNIGSERPAEEREKLRQRRATFAFGRMPSFWGWEGTQL